MPQLAERLELRASTSWTFEDATGAKRAAKQRTPPRRGAASAPSCEAIRRATTDLGGEKGTGPRSGRWTVLSLPCPERSNHRRRILRRRPLEEAPGLSCAHLDARRGGGRVGRPQAGPLRRHPSSAKLLGFASRGWMSRIARKWRPSVDSLPNNLYCPSRILCWPLVYRWQSLLGGHGWTWSPS